jgi:NitT/TauT family transport system permease protein
MKKILNIIQNKLFRYTGIIIVLVLWEVLPRLDLVSSRYLPPFSRVILKIICLYKDADLYMNIIVSLWRVVVGLGICLVISLVFGLSIGYFAKGLTEKFTPLFRLFGQINPYSLFPLFVLLLGIGEGAKVGIVIWTAIWPMLFHSFLGARAVDPNLIKAAESMAISKLKLFIKVILPSALPSVFLGLRIGVQMAFFILIASEMSGTIVGLGFMLHNAGNNYLVEELYAAGLCIVVLSVGINLFLVAFEKRLFFWRAKVNEYDDKEAKEVKRIGKLQIISLVLVLLFIFVAGIEQNEKANKYINDPKLRALDNA